MQEVEGVVGLLLGLLLLDILLQVLQPRGGQAGPRTRLPSQEPAKCSLEEEEGVAMMLPTAQEGLGVQALAQELFPQLEGLDQKGRTQQNQG